MQTGKARTDMFKLEDIYGLLAPTNSYERFGGPLVQLKFMAKGHVVVRTCCWDLMSHNRVAEV